MTKNIANPWGLTDRELEVVELFIELGSTKKVAPKLGLAIRTVYFHEKAIRRKMQVDEMLQAVLLFDRENRDYQVPVAFPKQEKPIKAWPELKAVNSVFALGMA